MLRMLVIFHLRYTSACAHTTLVARAENWVFPAVRLLTAGAPRHTWVRQHAVAASGGGETRESDGTCLVTYKPFSFLIPSCFLQPPKPLSSLSMLRDGNWRDGCY